jgi:hypothetical protein
MDDPKETDGRRIFVYRGTLPPALALLLLAPLLFLFLSVAAVLLAGGALAAVLLPVFLRGRRLPKRDADCITLERDEYARVDPKAPQLPPKR